MSVYQTYIDAMNDKIRKQSAISNPFKFKHIASLKVNRRQRKFLEKKT
jgi:cleavage and polyadenylation specificity factor subunit 3